MQINEVKLNIILSILLLVSSSFILCADEQESITITQKSISNNLQLTDSWLFTPNDDMQFILGYIDDFQWYKDDPADIWKNAVPEAATYEGVGWYTISFNLEVNNIADNLGISIPFCYGGYQLYLNSELLYESGQFDNEKVFGSRPIVLEIKNDILKQKSNILSLRVKSAIGLGGFGSNGIKPFIKLGLYKNIFTEFVRFIIQYTTIGFISIFLFVFFLFRYFLRKSDIFNLYFSIFSLSVGVFVLGFYGFWFYFFYQPWAYWLLTFLGGINMYLMPILFIHSFFGLKKGIISKIFTWFYALLNIILIGEFFFTGQIYFFMKYIYNFFNLSYIFLVLYLVFIGVKSIRKKLEYAKIMFVGIALLGLTFVYSMLTFIGVIHYTPLIGEGFFLMVLVFSFVLAKRFAGTHNKLELTHRELIVATEEIKSINLNLEDKVRKRTDELQTKNNQITESIEYASLIQNSVQPSHDELSSLFSEYFVLWKPRDIVGGDMYWSYKDDEGFMLAVFDCTGHGVPGALLTMTAAATLDHIVGEMKITDPAKVLNLLNRILKNRLNLNNPSEYSDDGLEIGIIRYNSQDKNLKYAGSRIQLHVIDQGALTEYKGDRHGIGYKRSKMDLQFKTYDIPLTDTAQYYMTTDGYIEQSGGENRYGLGWTRYKTLLNAIFRMPMAEQKKEIENYFENFRGTNEQRDDVLVFGFKIG